MLSGEAQIIERSSSNLGHRESGQTHVHRLLSSRKGRVINSFAACDADFPS